MFRMLCLALAITIQTATWGGEHVRMDLTASGATLEFDCARGTITESVPTVDATFSLKGTFTPDSRGPARGSGPRTVDATYSGTIKGDTMTLRITLAGSDSVAARYTLSKGNTGNVRKCR